MKATLNVPDELYRKVKAKSAIEGRTIREVAIELFEGWVHGDASVREEPAKYSSDQQYPGWFGALRKYAVHAKGRHDMDSVRKSIGRGIGDSL